MRTNEDHNTSSQATVPAMAPAATAPMIGNHVIQGRERVITPTSNPIAREGATRAENIVTATMARRLFHSRRIELGRRRFLLSTVQYIGNWAHTLKGAMSIVLAL